MRRVIAVLIAAGCSDGPRPAVDGGIDGGIVTKPPGCPALPAVETFDFFGESCAIAPGVATLCRNRAGWCIAGTCRPQCALLDASSCPACPQATQRYSPEIACYCAPPS